MAAPASASSRTRPLRAGSFPVRFFVDNSTGPARSAHLISRSRRSRAAFHNVTRAVEIAAGERRTVNVPIPAEMRYATVSAAGPGITENANSSMYSRTRTTCASCCPSAGPSSSRSSRAKAPRYSGANVFVHPVPPDEAPDELAAHLGYDAVVVPDAATLDNLDESKRRAIEGFVATGGHLVIGGVPRSQAVFLSRRT